MGGSDFPKAGPSCVNEKFSNGTTRMDIDDDMDFELSDSDDGDDVGSSFQELGEGSLNTFWYDPSKRRDDGWRQASLKFGKVTLEKPIFWTGYKFSADGGKDYLYLLPRHARLQNMTYSSKIRVDTRLEVFIENLASTDKFKTGVQQEVGKMVVSVHQSDILFGSHPVMVKSDLCNEKGAEKMDYEFDHGGYFIIKGAEKTFIAQEQMCLKRLDSKNPNWSIAYRSVAKRRKVT